MTDNINQPPLWCRECGATYMSMNESGECQICGTANILRMHLFTIAIPVVDFARDNARHNLEACLVQAIEMGILPEGTAIGDDND